MSRLAFALVGTILLIGNHTISEYLLAALRTRTDDNHVSEELEEIAATALTAMKGHSLAAALLAWVTLHRSAAEHTRLFGEDPEEFMDRISRSPTANTYPDLLAQANSIMARQYPGIG